VLFLLCGLFCRRSGLCRRWLVASLRSHVTPNTGQSPPTTAVIERMAINRDRLGLVRISPYIRKREIGRLLVEFVVLEFIRSIGTAAFAFLDFDESDF
jgi:hypothetical protein